MSPTIRIDEEVFEGLKELAEPLVDTPNTVIRRLLIEKGSLKAERKEANTSGKKIRARRGELTPQRVYEKWLLKVLHRDFEGRGQKSDVTKQVIRAMEAKKILTSPDYQKVSSGELRAENTIAWARNVLKDNGMIRADSPRGVWELTIAGIEKALSLDE